jgi:hypothetical protein
VTAPGSMKNVMTIDESGSRNNLCFGFCEAWRAGAERASGGGGSDLHSTIAPSIRTPFKCSAK